MKVLALALCLGLSGAMLVDRENPPADYDHSTYCQHFQKQVSHFSYFCVPPAPSWMDNLTS